MDNFEMVYKKLSSKVPFFEKLYYHYTKLNSLEEKDLLFLNTEKIGIQDINKNENSFSKTFKEIQYLRKLFLHELFKKRIVLVELIKAKKAYQ